MSHDINILLNNIRNLQKEFITDNFTTEIKKVVRNFFPKLNYQDIEIIQDFVISSKTKKITVELSKNNWGELPEVLKSIKL